jgi:imidazolonepropionase-like amidohydrolase
LEEVRAVVEEAEAQDRYVMAHAYTSKAVNRALDCGVRSIEHGNMIDAATAAKIVEKRAFLVPTVTVFWAMHKEGLSIGLPAIYQDKVKTVHDAAMQGRETAHRRGVKMVYGTDLFGPMHQHQSREFSIRAEIQKPIDVIRAATLNAAELFRRIGEIGEIVAGARADLLVVEGDPLRDLNLLQDQGRHMAAVMKDGRFHANRLLG